MKNQTLSFFVISFILLFGCTQAVQQGNDNFTERNKASIIKANGELFNKGNLSYADEVFTSDYAGQGPVWVKKHLGEMRTAFPDIQVSIDPIIAEGNMTAWLRTHTGTHQEEFMGFEPTNEKISWKTMIFSEYNVEGKVTKEWAVTDLFEVLANKKMDAESWDNEDGEGSVQE